MTDKKQTQKKTRPIQKPSEFKPHQQPNEQTPQPAERREKQADGDPGTTSTGPRDPSKKPS